MTEYVEIQIEPTRITGSGQRYRVWHEGEVLVDNTIDPSGDGARELVAMGVDLDARLMVSRVATPDRVDMSGRLGAFAGRRPTEGQDQSVRFIPWVPYFGPSNEAE